MIPTDPGEHFFGVDKASSNGRYSRIQATSGHDRNLLLQRSRLSNNRSFFFVSISLAKVVVEVISVHTFNTTDCWFTQPWHFRTSLEHK